MIFTIEGNIGVGKTTLLKRLEADELLPIPLTHQHMVVYEPVDDWMNVKDANSGESLFELYYRDKQKYGFVFQMMALQTRFDNIMNMANEHKDTILICERSFITDFEIFAKMMYDNGYITDIEMTVYKKWHDFIMKLFMPKINGHIYIHASPEKCFERVQKRGRKGEDVITLNYLKSVDERHEEWLCPSTCTGEAEAEAAAAASKPRVPVFKVDAFAEGSPNLTEIITFINKSIE